MMWSMITKYYVETIGILSAFGLFVGNWIWRRRKVAEISKEFETKIDLAAKEEQIKFHEESAKLERLSESTINRVPDSWHRVFEQTADNHKAKSESVSRGVPSSKRRVSKNTTKKS